MNNANVSVTLVNAVSEVIKTYPETIEYFERRTVMPSRVAKFVDFCEKTKTPLINPETFDSLSLSERNFWLLFLVQQEKMMVVEGISINELVSEVGEVLVAFTLLSYISYKVVSSYAKVKSPVGFDFDIPKNSNFLDHLSWIEDELYQKMGDISERSRDEVTSALAARMRKSI